MPRRLIPIYQALGRIDIAFLLALAGYFLVRWRAPGSGLALALTIVVYVLTAVEAVRLARFLIRGAIWRLRNRLIVAYLFIAVVPIVLILTLAGVGGYLVVSQVAGYLVSSELERRTSELLGPARMLAHSAPENRAQNLEQLAPYFEGRFPGLEILVDDRKPLRYPPAATLVSPPEGWKQASGVVLKTGLPYVWAHASNGNTRVTFLAPLTREFLAGLLPDLGDVSALGLRQRAGHGNARKNPVPEPANRFDAEVTWLTPINVAVWESPPHMDTSGLIVHSRISAVLGKVFGRESVDWGAGWFLLFAITAVLFLIVELISLVIGVSLTRTITRAVHELYAGTQQVKEGDFSHRIAVHGNDQLAELATSFNGMTENLERLIVVEKERERLQSELEIAREVQRQLFPKSTPELRTLELAGLCNPARMVSGDYYDFMSVDESSVALAIGDVAGKGISAALLMAAIQSIMRTQLSAGIPMAVAAGHGSLPQGLSTSHLVSVLNKQLYANTAPEKYATFYFGLYDEPSGVLTYTNAGHLSPFLVRNSHMERLDPTGTVVGAFPLSRYGEERVQLEAGDLLVAFTDGIVEPENEYGEMFGEERLADLILKLSRRRSDEIMAEVMDAVRLWTGSPELQDDMTLLVVRRR